MPPLLAIENLHTTIRRRRDEVRAVDGVSLTVDRGETLGIVGELAAARP